MSDKLVDSFVQVWEKIDLAQKILLSFHPRPDADSVSSNLALMKFLEKQGKEVTLISGDDDNPIEFNFLPGWTKVQGRTIGEISFQGYDLFISLDAGSEGRISNKFKLSSPLPITTVVIDHHYDNSKFGEVNLVDADARSTCEILSDVFAAKDESLVDKDIATCLYVGMWGDTMGFMSASKRTFAAVSKCLDYGIDTAKIVGDLTQIPYNHLVMMGKILSQSKLLFSKKAILSKVTFEELKAMGIVRSEAGQCKELSLYELRRNKESFISIFIYEYEPGRVSISLRSDDTEKVNVSKIAATLGGGGHPYAASAKHNGTVDEAEGMLLKAIAGVYPELGQP